MFAAHTRFLLMTSDYSTKDIETTVYQNTLDRFIDAFWQRDEARLNSFLVQPFRFALKNIDKTYQDRQALVRLFVGWRNALETMQTDVFHCTCRSANFVHGSADHILGNHETYMIRGNNFLREPFLCSMRLTRETGDLRLNEWSILLHGRELSAPCQVCFEEAGFDLDA